jgi:hypothetical protein
MTKKRHHYVPRTYLRAFRDLSGKVFVHLKDDPDKIIHQTPDEIAHHKYYYSQPLANGGRDHDALENLFSSVEDKWPGVVSRIRGSKNSKSLVEDLFEFICLQRARVPAIRDAAEKMDAEVVRATILTMEAQGKLPPRPEGLKDLFADLRIAIDPHRSIHAMPTFVTAMGKVLGRMGFGIFRNVTHVPFLSSDNPVIYFDPTVAEESMQPYNLLPGGEVALLFPIAPDLMLYGFSGLRDVFAYGGLGYADLKDLQKVEIFNQLVCRFAYRAVFSRDPGVEAIVKRYAHESPVVKISIVRAQKGHLVQQRSVFGAREEKEKWNTVQN